MKRAATWATGLVLLVSGSAGAFIIQPNDNLADESAVSRGTDRSSASANSLIKFTKTGATVSPATSADAIFSPMAQTKTQWFDANGNLEQKAVSPLPLKEDSNAVEPPQDDGGLTEGVSMSDPVASSSGPAPKEAPMPRAGWIGLAGVLGVMAARWISAARRSRTKSAAG
jgi:hypothetical protein